MNGIAVTQVNVKALIVSLVGAAILLFALVGTAGAASPVGKDGKIHACYRVKGKPKGSLRIVPAKQKRCKRGERKVSWSASSTTGIPGVNGTTGTTAGGQSGASGTNGTNGNELALKSQITDLALKLEGLEGILSGLTNNKLLGAVDAVKGLTNSDLTEAVQAVPVVEQLCTQSSALTEQDNLLTKGLTEEVSLGGVLPVGLLLNLPTISELNGFTCGTP
ncbi:MAG TPA: hypothetical protein VG816_13710 [Solirubrobacterales bacterium]|nr:hypothetical protein [Solirubrobacterales bacterium]